MPTSSSAVAVGTAAVKIYTSSQNPELVYLQDGDYDNASVVFVGGSNVTVDSGIKLSKVNPTVFSLYEFDKLFAISDAATGEVRVLGIS
jgi:thioredoxin reductase